MLNKNKRACTITAVALLLASFAIATMSVRGGNLPEVVVVIDYDAADELPEGIAVDKMGNLYVSLNPLGQL